MIVERSVGSTLSQSLESPGGLSPRVHGAVAPRKAVRTLARHRMVASMGRVGAAGDNAAMELFFSLLQKNVLNRRSWASREELRIASVTWIERTYHRRRRQDRLGRLRLSSSRPR